MPLKQYIVGHVCVSMCMYVLAYVNEKKKKDR